MPPDLHYTPSIKVLQHSRREHWDVRLAGADRNCHQPGCFACLLIGLRPQRRTPTSARAFGVCRYYPDLGSNSSDDDLAAHYLVTGRGANRVAERLRVVATYGFKWPGRDPSPYGGLCNQWYIHISMMAILLQMGAEVVRAAPS
jgi:hypothetical protein